MPPSRPTIPTRAWLLLVLAGIAGMLFYIDRQTLSVLKSTLKDDLGWSDADYSWLVTAFMVPYTFCYLVTGQLIDRWGTRVMMPVFLGIMSVATMLTGLAGNLWTMGACRFVLGAATEVRAPRFWQLEGGSYPDIDRALGLSRVLEAGVR